METPDASEVQIAAEQGFQKLIAGNQRFMRGEARFPTVCKEALADLARGLGSRSLLRRSWDAAIHGYLRN
jgi:hypothetical protein